MTVLAFRLPSSPAPVDDVDPFALAYASAWCDHMELEWMTQAYVAAWNAQRHDDCIMIVNRCKAIKRMDGARFVDRRDPYQKDHDEYVEEMGVAL